MVQAKTRFKSIEEYLAYNDGSDIRYELVDGVLVEMPAESPLNIQIGVFLIAVFLQMGIPIKRLGNKHQIEVQSTSVKAREPDLMVHSEESAQAIGRATQSLVTKDMPAPALVIEVVSPGEEHTQNYIRDYIEKRKEYAARNIPEYWLIDPDRSVVTVLRLAGDEYVGATFQGTDLVISPTFPELNLTADRILNAGE
jgi:Uma2 family endonuclease